LLPHKNIMCLHYKDNLDNVVKRIGIYSQNPMKHIRPLSGCSENCEMLKQMICRTIDLSWGIQREISADNSSTFFKTTITNVSHRRHKNGEGWINLFNVMSGKDKTCKHWHWFLCFLFLNLCLVINALNWGWKYFQRSNFVSLVNFEQQPKSSGFYGPLEVRNDLRQSGKTIVKTGIYLSYFKISYTWNRKNSKTL
jgi:hypothetical protein